MFLPYGVTTIADIHNDTAWSLAQREALKSGRIKGPRGSEYLALVRQKRSALRTALTPLLTARSIGEDEPARRLALISTVCRGST